MAYHGSDHGNPRLAAVLPWCLQGATMASLGVSRQAPRVAIGHGAVTACAMVVLKVRTMTIAMVANGCTMALDMTTFTDIP